MIYSRLPGETVKQAARRNEVLATYIGPFREKRIIIPTEDPVPTRSEPKPEQMPEERPVENPELVPA